MLLKNIHLHIGKADFSVRHILCVRLETETGLKSGFEFLHGDGNLSQCWEMFSA